MSYLREKALEVSLEDHISPPMPQDPWDVELVMREAKGENATHFLGELQDEFPTSIPCFLISLQLSKRDAVPAPLPLFRPSWSRLHLWVAYLPKTDSIMRFTADEDGNVSIFINVNWGFSVEEVLARPACCFQGYRPQEINAGGRGCGELLWIQNRRLRFLGLGWMSQHTFLANPNP